MGLRFSPADSFANCSLHLAQFDILFVTIPGILPHPGDSDSFREAIDMSNEHDESQGDGVARLLPKEVSEVEMIRKDRAGGQKNVLQIRPSVRVVCEEVTTGVKTVDDSTRR